MSAIDDIEALAFALPLPAIIEAIERLVKLARAQTTENELRAGEAVVDADVDELERGKFGPP